MNRRRFLEFAASGGSGILAGCSSAESDEHATLQSVHLVNAVDTTVTVELRIERYETGERVHEGTYELTVDPKWMTLDCVWPNAPVTVMVRPASGEWNSLSTSIGDECLGIIAKIRDQRPGFYAHTATCPIRDADCHADNAE